MCTDNSQKEINIAKMSDEKIKHLEFIQDVITRMAHNSFMIKNWCITVTVALLAIASKIDNVVFVIVSIFTTIMFWILDSYYIQQERKFRVLYDDAIAPDFPVFKMSPSKELLSLPKNKKNLNFWRVFFSKTIVMLYPTLIVMVLFVSSLTKFGIIHTAID